MQKLSSYSLPWPTNWTAIFGKSQPLIVEIGFGSGVFLLHLARQNSHANIIGLEIANRSLDHAEAAIARAELENVRVVHSTAETALRHLFEPHSISQIHINFPDPWFKRRHTHRRLLQTDTLNAMVNRLIAGGLLYLSTDIYDYAEMSAELLSQTPQLHNTLSSAWVNSMPGRAITKYESEAHRAGRTCYYFAYRRNAVPAPDVPVITELDMPHLVVQTPLDLDAMLAKFEQSQHVHQQTHVHMMYVYRGANSLLFEVFVNEPTINQRLALLLTAHETNADQYTLRISQLGQPRITEGLHLAVGLLGDWLAGLHASARIVTSKLRSYPPG